MASCFTSVTGFLNLNFWWQALPVFTFANEAGLDMLETTLVALQDITLEKMFDENGRKALYSELPQIMQQVCDKSKTPMWCPAYATLFMKYHVALQGFACLQGGICLSSMGRPISYERAVAWKVMNEEEDAHCICFMFINWSFVWYFVGTDTYLDQQTLVF